MNFGIFGEEPYDIESIYILSDASENWQAVYIKRTNGVIDKTEIRPDQDPIEFKKEVWAKMKASGATKENRQDKWFIFTKENNLVNFEELDNYFEKTHYKVNINGKETYMLTHEEIVRASGKNKKSEEPSLPEPAPVKDETDDKKSTPADSEPRTVIIKDEEKDEEKKDTETKEPPAPRVEVPSYDSIDRFSEEQSMQILKENLEIIKNRLGPENQENKSEQKFQKMAMKKIRNFKKMEKNQVKNAKNAERFKIKSVSDIYAHAKKPAFWAATDAIVTVGCAIASWAYLKGHLSFSAEVIPGVVGIAATVVAYKKTKHHLFEIHMDKIKENTKTFVTERAKAALEDAKSGIKNTWNALIDKGAEKVESGGRSR